MKKAFLLLFSAGIMASCNSPKNTFSGRESASKSPWNKQIEYAGGKGTSYEDAIIIKNAKNSYDGVPAEYDYLNATLGKRGTDWISLGQSLQHHNNKSFDVIHVVKQKDTMDVYFDITEFFGKF